MDVVKLQEAPTASPNLSESSMGVVKTSEATKNAMLPTLRDYAPDGHGFNVVGVGGLPHLQSACFSHFQDWENWNHYVFSFTSFKMVNLSKAHMAAPMLSESPMGSTS